MERLSVDDNPIYLLNSGGDGINKYKLKYNNIWSELPNAMRLICSMERTEWMMVRWMCGVTLRDRILRACGVK
jgi:hypothetical protein